MDMNNKDDIEKLKEFMGIINHAVPELISSIIQAVYNTENSDKIARNKTKFYKELTNSGMQKQQAYVLTRDYLRDRDVGSLVREVMI